MGTLRSLFRLATGRSRVEADVEDELELHRALAEEELLRQGVAPGDAARRAADELGDRAALSRRVLAIDRVRERRMRRAEVIGKWQSDLRLARRGFRRDPWFTAAAVLLVALGVGANIAVFSILNAAFVRALPYPDADRIVTVVETRQGRGMAVAGANLRDWQRSANEFAHLAGYYITDAVLTGAGAPETIATAVASRTFPAVLGIDPMLGRWFDAEEAVAGGAPAVVLSEGYWRDRFGADPDVLGRQVRVDGLAATIVGVMPRRVDFPVGAQIWMPAERWDDGPSRTAHNWRVIGRLRAGVDPETATRSLSVFTRQIVAGEGDSDFLADGARVTPFRQTLLGQSPRVLGLLQGAVGLLLLIAVLNLTALLLARAAKRQGELVMLRTLGATRIDLIRRFVVESVLLTAAGVALGVAAWLPLRAALVRAIDRIVPFVRTLPIDLPFLAFIAGLVLVVGIVAGVVPALWAARSVEDGSAARPSHRIVGPSRVLQTLIGVEVAATFVLLAGAGLLSRSLARMLDQDLGFRSEGRVVIPLPLPVDAGNLVGDLERRGLVLEAARERLAAIPGVASVALTTAVPLQGGSPNGGGMIQGEPSSTGGPGATADFRVVSPGFFEVLGIPVTRGRDFTAHDRAGAARVAIVNDAFVRTYLPGGDPLGRLVRMPGMDIVSSGEDWAAIVGVVGDVRQEGPGVEPDPTMYFPLGQRPQLRLVSAVARVDGPPGPVLRAAQGELARLDPEMPFDGILLAHALNDVVAVPKLRTIVLGVFASAALLLAGVGLFGVVGFIVLRRTREIGVRLALGAPRTNVAGTAFGHALRPVLLGLLAGVAGALALGQVVRGFLFEVSPGNPVVFGGAAALVLSTAALACIGPIRRALAVDPATVLRSDDAR